MDILPSCVLERLGFVCSAGMSTMVGLKIVRNGVFGHLKTFHSINLVSYLTSFDNIIRTK